MNVDSSANDVSLLAALFSFFQFSHSNHAILQGKHCIKIPLSILLHSFILHLLDNFLQSIQLEQINIHSIISLYSDFVFANFSLRCVTCFGFNKLHISLLQKQSLNPKHT